MPGLLAAVCALLPLSALSAAVKVHPVPDAVRDSPYIVTVGGVSVPIEKAGDSRGAFYARFITDQPAAAEISVRGADIKAACKPQAEGFRAEGGRLTLEVGNNRRHIVTATAGGKPLWPLILISEPELRHKPPGKVFDIAKYLEPGAKVQTKGIQKALDECAGHAEGGVVFFGPGIYRTGTIRIGSNTTVFLAPGAVIMGSTDPADYPVDPGRKETGTHGPVCSFSRLVLFDNAKNSSIEGHGVIDGRGHIVRNKNKRHVQLVDVTGCEYVRIVNTVLRNSAEWTLHVLGSKDITIENLSIINDWNVENTDGIDPDGSVDVSISNYLGFCGDDAVAIKTTGNSGLLQPVTGITVTDSVLMSKKTALKVGTETYADVSGVRFMNCDVVNSSRALAVYARDGGNVSDITFEDIRIDLREFSDEDKSGEFVRLDGVPRKGLGSIEDVAFRNIVCATPYRSVMIGDPKRPIRNVTYENVNIRLLNRSTRTERVAVISMSQCDGVSFKNFTIDRSGADSELWGGPFSQRNCKHITQDGVDAGAAGQTAPTPASR